MSLFIQKIVFLFVLTLLSVHTVLGGVTVNLVNSLEGNLDLTVRCQSADDDLGSHLLHHGNNYSFHFVPKLPLFGQTLFFCSFAWNGGFHHFDVWVQGIDDCNYCNYNIFKSGPCLSQEPKAPDCFTWKD